MSPLNEGKHIMEKTNKRVVQRRDDGNWEVRKPGASHASAITPTQSAGISKARDILNKDGGGELQVRSLKGTIRFFRSKCGGYARRANLAPRSDTSRSLRQG